MFNYCIEFFIGRRFAEMEVYILLTKLIQNIRYILLTKLIQNFRYILLTKLIQNFRYILLTKLIQNFRYILLVKVRFAVLEVNTACTIIAEG